MSHVMLDVFICDEDAAVAEHLKKLVSGYAEYDTKVVITSNEAELLGLVEINERIPDVLIMDIRPGEKNGIDTVKLLQQHYPEIKVIYITGFINFATAIFETEPSGFLTKPLKEEEFLHILEKVSGQVRKKKENSILIRRNGTEIRLFRSDIVYAESRGRQVFIHNADGGVDVIYEKIDVLQEQLGASFVRSHKSFLINMKYIVRRTNKEFFLTNGIVLPISKPNLKDASARFVAFFGDICEQEDM